MALVNKAWRESTFVPPGAEPGLQSARPFMETVQNNAVQQIAKARFPFPSREHELWKTYTNRPEHTAGVRMANGDLLFPDIVVLNTSSTEVEFLAEVETTRSLLEPDAVDKWKAFGQAGPFYLYVPLSQLDAARARLAGAGVRLAGFRSWKVNLGQQMVEVLEMSV